MPVRVSPSLVESLNTCPLRAVLGRRGARTEPGPAQLEGMVVHALVHGLSSGVPQQSLRAEIESFLRTQENLPPWQVARTRRALESMLTAAQAWVGDNHPPRSLLGSEIEMDVLVPPADDATDSAEVRLVGRVDWLSRSPDGAVVVTDFKTGATVPSRAEAQGNAQLAAYQAAIALGAFSGSGEPESRPGGGELVYLRGGRPKVLTQDRLTDGATPAWLGSIRSAAAHLASATAWAQENAGCERCPVRTSCPLQNEGRQVTR